METETDISCNGIARLNKARRATVSWSHNRYLNSAIYLIIFKIRASLLRVHKTLLNVRTNICALHCNNLDCLLSCVNSLNVYHNNACSWVNCEKSFIRYIFVFKIFDFNRSLVLDVWYKINRNNE